jgi:hypothetical protein
VQVAERPLKIARSHGAMRAAAKPARAQEAPASRSAKA